MRTRIRSMDEILKKEMYMIKKLIFVLLLAMAFFIAVGPAQAAILNVDVNGGPGVYTSIQAAVDAAASGDTIMVGPGTYDGFIVMLKSVKVIGSGNDTLITRAQTKDARFYGDAITILRANETEINNLAIDISGDPPPAGSTPCGIDLRRSNGAVINGVEIRKTNTVAINAFLSDNIKLIHNKIKGFPADFISTDDNPPTGFTLFGITNSLVAFNHVVSDNTDVAASGIFLYNYFTIFPAAGNKIVHNIIQTKTGTNNAYGFALVEDSPGMVKNNLIGFNDFRGSAPDQIIVWPPDLVSCTSSSDACNIFSRNLGDNRRYAPLPSGYKVNIFRPGLED